MSETNNLNIISNSVLFNRKVYGKRGVKCPLSTPNSPVINYKDVELLKEFISEKGRIISSRISGVCPPKQRMLKQAIKRARALALLPFLSNKS